MKLIIINPALQRLLGLKIAAGCPSLSVFKTHREIFIHKTVHTWHSMNETQTRFLTAPAQKMFSLLGAGPRIETGPAVQQADTLLYEQPKLS